VEILHTFYDKSLIKGLESLRLRGLSEDKPLGIKYLLKRKSSRGDKN
jgi:hypothetical protein